MKTFLIMAISALFAIAPQQNSSPSPEDYKIVSDQVENGVRTIVATPSPMVCSKKVTIKVDAKTDVIQSAVFYRGCDGNLKAINILLKGMTVQEAVKKLYGVNCGGRGTSCTDQLARILKHCYKLK